MKPRIHRPQQWDILKALGTDFFTDGDKAEKSAFFIRCWRY